MRAARGAPHRVPALLAWLGGLRARLAAGHLTQDDCAFAGELAYLEVILCRLSKFCAASIASYCAIQSYEQPES